MTAILPTGPSAAALDQGERAAVVETVHRQHAPDVWRDTLATERALVTLEDVMVHLGVTDESGIYDALRQGNHARDLDYTALIAGIQNEIAISRAQAKLPSELWRRANAEASA